MYKEDNWYVADKQVQQSCCAVDSFLLPLLVFIKGKKRPYIQSCSHVLFNTYESFCCFLYAGVYVIEVFLLSPT